MYVPGALLQHRYRIERALGEGGMGTAYLAWDLLQEAPVALKLLRVGSAALLEVFRAEFSTLRGLSHPNLCQVHDFGTARGPGGEPVFFYTAEHVEGVPLDRYAEGRTWDELAAPFARALDALGFLHRALVRHGDFKPDNVLVEPSGRAVLLDLGCSAPLGQEALQDRVSGTPGFLAPELQRGEPADHRADLYAAGVTLEQLARRLAAPLPEPVAALAWRLTRPAKEQRPADVDEVLDALGAPSTSTLGAPGRLTAPSAPNPDARARTRAVVVEAPRLLGRAAEMEVFGRLLDGVLAGREGARGLFVHGPDGAGRTRLLREMKHAAQLRCAVVEGRAAGALPVTAMLRRATGDLALPPNVAGILSARELLAAGEPIALFLDDLHLAPEAERELFLSLLRSLEPADRLLVACASAAEPPPLGPGVVALPVGPLGEADVAAWLSLRAVRPRVADIVRATGGFPGAIRDLLLLLATEDRAELDLDSASGRVRLSEARAASLRALPAAAQRALGLIAAEGGAVGPALAREAALDRGAAGALLQRGLVVPDEGGLRLARPGEAARLLDALGPEVTRPIHRAAAERLREQLASLLPGAAAAASACAARLVHHLCLAGLPAEAEEVAARSRALFAASPEGWPRAAAALAHVGRDSPPDVAAPRVLLLAAEIHDAAGQPREALRLLAALLRRRPPAADRAAVWLRAGASWLKLGNARRALRYLARAERDPALRARALELVARAHVDAGAYAEAMTCARAALDAAGPAGAAGAGGAMPGDAALRADLHNDLGLAASYLGDTLTARAHLREAARLHEAAGSAQGLARAAGGLAINEFRTGDASAAALGYRHALEVAERCGTSHQIASATLNLGTACHQEGDLGEALAAYERSLRMAVALGRRSTAVRCHYNLAKLSADVGLFERAEAAAQRASAEARAEGLRFIAAEAAGVEGEIALARRDVGRALARFDHARAELAAEGASREVAEVDLLRAEAYLARGELPAAAEAAAAARAALSAQTAHPAGDLAARVELADAKRLVAEGAPGAAVAPLERAQALARRVGQRLLQAEVEAWLAAAHDRRGAPALAEPHRARARALWERAAGALPPHFQEAFWRHPSRAAAREGAAPQRDPARVAAIARALTGINEKLRACVRTEEVLSSTMDGAIELTGAERGFVLLVKPTRHEPELEVAAARNLDREDIHRSHLKFSKGIADRVILTGEPVVTNNAQVDDRFAKNESVHAMRLQSIVCVPIRGEAGVLGALYLDHRFEKGLFDAQDAELLTAFADQVAIALQQARLREAQADPRARPAPSPSAAPARARPAPEPRRAYPHIVGRSAAMQAVFAVLDRVVESPVSVLVQGESGTGKELVARALHEGGPRKAGPLVAVNCGAVPDALLESELFGHVKGAFTGADKDHKGVFERAHGGTLFLDEIGEMPQEMQVKLLRALQEREIRPVGSAKEIPVDIRLVCATNRNLKDEMEAGRFRNDLYYRIGVVVVKLPPLRERAEDIPDLVAHLLDRAARAHGRPAPEPTPEAMRLLMAHAWPGNVRELENVLVSALLLCDGGRITPEDLQALSPSAAPVAEPTGRDAFAAAEARKMIAVLNDTGWNASEACRRLKMPRATFYRKCERYGIKLGKRGGDEG